MKRLQRLSLILVALLLLLLLAGIGGGYLFLRRSWPVTRGELQVAGLQALVEIYRDRWGVPHIYAQNAEDLFFAQGYVHAQDRLWQMDFQRRIGHGRLSEVLGEATVKTDRFLRTIGIHRAAQADLEHLDSESRRYLEAYARGVTAYIESHKGRLPVEFRLLGYTPEPWQPIDSLVWAKMMAWDLGGNWELELLRARIVEKLGADALPGLFPTYPEDAPLIVPPEVRAYRDLGAPSLVAVGRINEAVGMAGDGFGSNSWVVAGRRTATGAPLLANDPHLGIRMPSIWYEIGLHGGGFDVVGASLPGTPGVVLGHNNRIAWGFTNLGPDVQDLYIERMNPENPYQVEYEGRWEDVQVVREEIRVKGRPPETLEVRITRHGPLINDVVEGLEQPVAFRWTAISEPSEIFQAILGLNRARNWEEFRAALKHFTVPGQNIIYADVEGNIGYQATGWIPIRAQGDGRLPVPGWTGAYEWTGFIPYEELPSVLNPPSGQIVTANNRVVGDDYLYLLTYDWAAPYRAQRIIDLLGDHKGLTVQDFQAIQADVYATPAERLVPYIVDAVQPQNFLEEEALERLKNWDYRMTADSPAASIFEAVYRELVRQLFGDELGDELLTSYLKFGAAHHVAVERLLDDPQNPWWDDVRTPQRETRDEILTRAFQRGVDWLGSQLGDQTSAWPWGRVHGAAFEHPLGAIKPLNLLFNRGPIPAQGSGVTVNRAGFRYAKDFSVRGLSSYRQIIDLGDWERSRSMHTTGQSGHPFHPHYADMIAPWQAVRYHSMGWDRDRLAAGGAERLVLKPAR